MAAAKLDESWSQNKFNEVSSVNGLSDFTFDLMTCIKLCPKDLLGFAFAKLFCWCQNKKKGKKMTFISSDSKVDSCISPNNTAYCTIFAIKIKIGNQPYIPYKEVTDT